MNMRAVSKVRLDPERRVVAIFRGPMDTTRNRRAGAESVAPVEEVVAALDRGARVCALFRTEHGHLPQRRFVVVDCDNGWKTIALAGAAPHEREIHDMERL